jgi:hypothetical protein
MQTLSNDTTEAAERVQIDLLRQAGITKRVDLAADMTRFAIDAARFALRRQHPNASDEDINILFVEYHYGSALANRIRAMLAKSHTYDIFS